VREALKALPYALQKRLYPIAVEDVRRVHFRFEHQTLRISTSKWRFLPFTSFLPESYPRSLSMPVVFTDCESTMAALGWVFRLTRARRRFRRAAFSFSQVPSMRQVLK